MNDLLHTIGTNAGLTVLLALVLVFLIVAAILGRRLDVKLGSVHAQLSPNGGNSALDLIRKTNEHVKHIDARVAKLESTALTVHPETDPED